MLLLSSWPTTNDCRNFLPSLFSTELGSACSLTDAAKYQCFKYFFILNCYLSDIFLPNHIKILRHTTVINTYNYKITHTLSINEISYVYVEVTASMDTISEILRGGVEVIALNGMYDRVSGHRCIDQCRSDSLNMYTAVSTVKHP